MKDRIRDLFAVPPAEFTGARDQLAKELRAAGHDAEAKEVAALRRPTAPVWAVNQLARRSAAELEQLLDSSERVRHAQVRGASGDELRAAMAGQRDALARLERAAEQVLRDANLQTSAGALRTIQSTLQAAATGPPEVREQLRQGTMREALEPAGFEALLGAGVTPAGHAPAQAAARSSPAAVKAAARATTAKPDSAASRRAAAAAERAARDEAREAKRLAAEKAREERARAREEMRLEGELRKLERRAQAAERAATQAREAVEAARSRLDQLKR